MTVCKDLALMDVQASIKLHFICMSQMRIYGEVAQLP